MFCLLRSTQQYHPHNRSMQRETTAVGSGWVVAGRDCVGGKPTLDSKLSLNQ